MSSKKRLLNPVQKANLEQLNSNLGEDLVQGYSVGSSTGKGSKSAWIARIKSLSDDLSQNAYAYYNFQRRRGGGWYDKKRSPQRVLSAKDFPPGITISYALPPPYSFSDPGKVRDVKFFCLHSFGHSWHTKLSKTSGKRVGWMNNPNRGVTAIQHGGRTIYVPKGTDAKNMAHFARFANGLRTCLNNSAKVGAHFFIDRNGNLVVVGDCNDVLHTSGGINNEQIGVEMEEALFKLSDTKGQGNKAILKYGHGATAGKGVGSTIEYFDYTNAQLLTLAILIKKLQTVYPHLRTRKHYKDTHTMNSSSTPGYTMHLAIQGSTHFDVAPHFRNDKAWDDLFNLVAKQRVSSNSAFRPAQSLKDLGKNFKVEPLSSEVITASNSALLELARSQGMAYNRSSSAAMSNRAVVNRFAGGNASKGALIMKDRAAYYNRMAEQFQKPVETYPQVTNKPNGQQEGSDDMW